jgi:phosphomannomutase / phosphoglucomutase
MNPQIFREYDIRGLVGTDVTEEVAELIGKGLGTLLAREQKNQVSVARDVRLSSPAMRDALIKGLLSTGMHVRDLGAVPTPVSYFSLFHYDLDGGVMITGSHNPPEYNGFKVEVGKTTIHGQQIQDFRTLIESGDFVTGEGTLEEVDILTPYTEMMLTKFTPARGLKMVVDGGNGVAGVVTPQLMRKMNCEVTELFCEPDGNFPNHHPDPTVDANMTALKELVVEQGFELGVGYDGDADRIGVVDDTGRLVRGDQLVAIFARALLESVPGAAVLFDVKCSRGLEEDIAAHGGKPFMWKTGHSLLKNKMKEEKALLAGEMSGHIFFGHNYYGYDDAAYATCWLVDILSRTDKKLSEIVDTLPQYHSTPEIRVDTTEEAKWGIVEQMTAWYKARYDVIDIDGVRVNFPDGWGLVRASNTQPALVMRFEATSEEALKAIGDDMSGKMKELGCTVNLP